MRECLFVSCFVYKCSCSVSPCRSICTGWQSSWQLVRGCVGGLGERLGSHDSDHRLHDGSNPCRLAARPHHRLLLLGGNLIGQHWLLWVGEGNIRIFQSKLIGETCGDIFAKLYYISCTFYKNLRWNVLWVTLKAYSVLSKTNKHESVSVLCWLLQVSQLGIEMSGEWPKRLMLYRVSF